MDERYDMVRTVRDQNFIYIRNYMPHKIYGQYIQYMFKTPTTRIWKERFDQGKLNAAQSRFWQTKPAEELYDLRKDPDQLHNVAKQTEYARTRDKLASALRAQLTATKDPRVLGQGDLFDRYPYYGGRQPKQT